jgi:hypothetical protein
MWIYMIINFDAYNGCKPVQKRVIHATYILNRISGSPNTSEAKRRSSMQRGADDVAAWSSMVRIGDGEDIDRRWRGLFSPQQASAAHTARVHETIILRGRRWGDRARIWGIEVIESNQRSRSGSRRTSTRIVTRKKSDLGFRSGLDKCVRTYRRAKAKKKAAESVKTEEVISDGNLTIEERSRRSLKRWGDSVSRYRAVRCCV